MKYKHVIDYIRNNRSQFFDSLLVGYFKWLPDTIYLRIRYRCHMGVWPDLRHPETYNEKLNWLKLHDRKDIYSKLVDKYSVKEYVSEIIGPEYVIPTLGVWDRPEDIDWDSLPDKFVLKTTNGGGNSGVVICTDKKTLDRQKAVLKLKKSMKQDIYRTLREWPYKNVKKRIIAETFIAEPDVDGTGYKDLRDYKFFCFDGEVRALFVGSERQTRKEPYFDFFDSEFRLLPIKQGHPNSPVPPDKPDSFDLMKELASELSKGFPTIRVDLYESYGKVYFGELTFYHFGGMIPFVPDKWDKQFGDWIKLDIE